MDQIIANVPEWLSLSFLVGIFFVYLSGFSRNESEHSQMETQISHLQKGLDCLESKIEIFYLNVIKKIKHDKT